MKHLGGHGNKTWTDKGALKHIKKRFNINSMVDIGCGPAGMRGVADSLDIKWLGIDGDPSVLQDRVIMHDFTKGVVKTDNFDLGWSVEFLEHVYEEYQPNYMDTFVKCKYVLCTAAPPGWDGYHHVNEQPREYWIDVFSKYGFVYDEKITNEVKKNSTMKKKKGKSFMRRNGMFFRSIDIE